MLECMVRCIRVWVWFLDTCWTGSETEVETAVLRPWGYREGPGRQPFSQH